MVSNTHEDGQTVVSEEITLTSPPINTYGSHNAANLPSVNANDLSVEAVAVDNENELSHIEIEMIVCDTCGDVGYEHLLVICSKCKVGAEHTYCMVVKVDVPHEEWICYDCTEDKDGVREGEETSTMERKIESSIDPFKMEERRLSQEQPGLLSTGLNIDLNVDPNIDMNEEPSSRKRKIGPSVDFPELIEEASSQADLSNTSRSKIMCFIQYKTSTMDSNTHEDGQTVVSEEITQTSPPRNTYGSNNAANFPSVNENDLSVEAVAVDNENELSHIEEEMIVCDTCGDVGYEHLLVICSKCKVGAEHTYCMVVKVDVPHEEWICYDCTEDKDGVREGEETSTMERKIESSIDPFKMEERTLSQEQPGLLSTGLNIDLNVDPNIDMNEEPSSRKRKIGPSVDFPELTEEASSQADLSNTSRHKIMWLDLNKDPNPDFDEDPNIGLM
ncbi:hypothetical protein Bca4012_023722 [Brassica carinata]|uniref:Zinc finger PHD-type domain-containing protein n=1 Tax=Brassica carinata TaxID=52824 RepID=A0A8X7NV50_BRACI|nr:hypothetical protein Bca52824_089798 [Brassica carinata]